MARATKSLSSTPFFVLLALADEDRYGLGIIDEVERRTAGSVVLGPGTLYNTIKRLLAAGQIVELRGADAPGDADPRRRYYRITESGRRQVSAEAERLSRLVEVARAKRLMTDRGDS